jgi:hypothetical protein
VVFIQLASLLVAAGLATAAGASRPLSFSLPEQASEVAPGVFFLGEFVQDGVALEGYAYARYAEPAEVGRRGNAKPDWAGGGKGGGGGEETDAKTCYSYIAKGAKWNTAEPYLFNPYNNGNIGLIGVAETDGVFATWEDAAGKPANDIVGSGNSVPKEYELVADTSGTDGQNEIYFATITDPGVLGYTIVWYTRSRGRFVGQIVESDMVIDNDGDWSWYTGDSSSEIKEGEFDFWGVFTHEAGHWVGMGHTKTTDLCTEQTMYPSISSKDSSKRSLELGDTTGVHALYN